MAKWAAQLFERLGVLNQGSATAAKTAGISTNTLNVTRVSGLTVLVGSVGAAALEIFKVKPKTPVPEVVAAYASVGVIVAAALLTAAIIVSADVRARTAAQVGAAQPDAKTQPSAAKTKHSPAKHESLTAAWNDVLKQLGDVQEEMADNPGNALGSWLDAAATEGLTAHLSPADGQEERLHAQLTACRSRVVAKYQSRIDETDTARLGAVATDIQALTHIMQRLLDATGSSNS